VWVDSSGSCSFEGGIAAEDVSGRNGLSYLRKLKLPYLRDFLLAQDLKSSLGVGSLY